MLSPEKSQYAQHWGLDPTVTYLNHGSYGATPLPVLAYQSQLRQQIEAEPVQFFAHSLEPLLDHARTVLARFVGADPANLVLVPNATVGVNTVLRSLFLKAGDEILITDHTYNACRNALQWLVDNADIQLQVVDIPFQIASAQVVIDAILDRVTSRTRLVFLDHVTSPTALIFPLAPIIEILNQRGIDTLIDGAHAPGMIPLDLQSLGATYYTGNCHKWLCAPKGAAFLYVRPDKQSTLRPLTISHGANSPRDDRSRFHLEFDWTGTHDPTPYLCIPQAIDFMESLLPGGWDQLRSQNHHLVLRARQEIQDHLGLSTPCPDDLIGSMAALNLENLTISPTVLYQRIWRIHRVEVPLIPWKTGKTLVRISAQVYNILAEYNFLAKILKEQAFL
jgi:isopenicillin-N epimerase